MLFIVILTILVINYVLKYKVKMKKEPNLGINISFFLTSMLLFLFAWIYSAVVLNQNISIATIGMLVMASHLKEAYDSLMYILNKSIAN